MSTSTGSSPSPTALPTFSPFDAFTETSAERSAATDLSRVLIESINHDACETKRSAKALHHLVRVCGNTYKWINTVIKSVEEDDVGSWENYDKYIAAIDILEGSLFEIAIVSEKESKQWTFSDFSIEGCIGWVNDWEVRRNTLRVHQSKLTKLVTSPATDYHDEEKYDGIDWLNILCMRIQAHSLDDVKSVERVHSNVIADMKKHTAYMPSAITARTSIESLTLAVKNVMIVYGLMEMAVNSADNEMQTRLKCAEVWTMATNLIISTVNHLEQGSPNLEKQQSKWDDFIIFLRVTYGPSGQRASSGRDSPSNIPVSAGSSILSNTGTQSKVYKNLLSLVWHNLGTYMNANPMSQTSLGYVGALRDICEPMQNRDQLSCLVESHHYHIQLLEFLSNLGIREQAKVREALVKDDMDIFEVVRKILRSDMTGVVRGLDEKGAEKFMDLLQKLLNRNPQWGQKDSETFHSARQLTVELSRACHSLPSSLFIGGVQCLEQKVSTGGGFGDIFLGIYRDGYVALKRLQIFRTSRDCRKLHQMFCRETLMWTALNHPHILPFLGIDRETFPGFMCMVSPWMQRGTILSHLEDVGIAAVDVDRLLFEIAQGVEYLHSQSVVHGDLRGANILIDDDWHVRLADFGLSTFGEVTEAKHTTTYRGAVRWMAPELHYPQEFGATRFQRTYASDVYSFACVCVEVYTGENPFSELRNETAVLLEVIGGSRPKRPGHDSRRAMSDSLWILVQSCWSREFSARPTMQAVVLDLKTI